MLPLLIDSLDDSRLDAYRELRHKGRQPPELFVAEGEKLATRLFESGCLTRSVLCTTAAFERLKHVIPAESAIYLAPTSLISRLIGFRFHRGVIACGVRPPEQTLDSLLAQLSGAEPHMLVALPEIRDPENLGTIVRTAAAFGAAGVLVGRAGTDPFSRRVLRTSMGSVLKVPIVPIDDWSAVAGSLHAAGFHTVATVLDPTAQRLADADRPARLAMFFGNEDAGLPADLVRACWQQVRLPMSAGVDSLNVAVAAGIVLHHYSSAAE